MARPTAWTMAKKIVPYLHDDAGVDIRSDPESEHAESPEGSSGEEVQKTKDASLREQPRHGLRVYSGRRNMCSQSVHEKSRDDE